MKKLLLLSTILTLITSCSISKRPVFKYIDKIAIKNVSMRNVTVKTNAIFDNPNNVRGKLSVDSIHVFVDNIDVGIVYSQEFQVPAKKEFALPLEASFSISEIYKKNKNGLLGSILKIAQTDSLLIQYKGNIRYRLAGFSYTYKVNKEQQVSLKQ